MFLESRQIDFIKRQIKYVSLILISLGVNVIRVVGRESCCADVLGIAFGDDCNDLIY